ncbi:MAG: three-Cys-motif partner protein TcmP [Pleurocapsa minor GSE-CHR-MK-17-07R]|jgi:three-Cys-motif partner protein|nr:three-Cys-motif partner protein TcmP [Pleurocapsa minor GSE-CHR-MK 17-07R]
MESDRLLAPVEDGLEYRDSQPYAKQKLKSVNYYLQQAITATKGKFRDICYLDLQAGPGKNKIGSEIVLGSPLIALNLPNPPTLLLFNEDKKKLSESLKQRVQASPIADRVRIFREDVNDVAGKMIDVLPNRGKYSLNIAFLDPEGLEINWSTIQLLADVRRMDLIINFSSSGVKRSLQHPDKLDAFFGTPNWREIDLKSTRAMVDLYLSRLRGFGYTIIEDPEIPGEEVRVRNSKNAELYTMIFASKHPLGNKFWKNAADSTKPPRLPGFE